MKKTLSTSLLSVSVAASTYLFLATSQASAQLGLDPCDNKGAHAVSNNLCNLSGNSIPQVIRNVIIAILVGAAILALFFLILGGIRWITSGGDKGKVEAARSTIVAAIIGLIIAFLAYFILSLILGFFGLSLTNLVIPKIVP